MDYLISSNSGAELTTSQAAFAGAFTGTILIASLIFAVLVIIGQWKIFEKAGEKGWKSLIPIYGQYILFKIIGAKTWFWVFLCATIICSIMMTANTPAVNWYGTQAEVEAELNLVDWNQYIPFLVGLVITCFIAIIMEILVAIKLSKAFGKGAAYIIGLIFVPEIVLLVLGFGKAKYDKKVLKD